MEIESKTYQEKLNNIEKEFYLLMQQFNKYYVLSNTTKNSSNKRFFFNTQNNIDDLFNKYSNLETTLHKTIQNIKKDFIKKDKEIDNLKEKLEKIKDLNVKLKQKIDASKDFKKQINKYRKDNKILMLYHFVGVLGISYFIYSSIRN